jgi:hypothetical protein
MVVRIIRIPEADMTTARRFVVIFLISGVSVAARAADDKILPASLSADQKDKMLKFLKAHEAPDRYVPREAKFVDGKPPAADAEVTGTKDKPIKQYTVQITPHRVVPDQESVTKADVYYYRPNPEKGKPGLTVKYTVDLTTGEQIGETEVLTKAHTPVSREELAEAVSAVKEKSEAVKALYTGREAADVTWEYLQMKINRKSAQFEPGDRVVRFVFTATPVGNREPTPVRVIVNLTKDTITADDR